MNKIAEQELLKDRRVVEEINRHLWLESEKAGRDIGFDQAKEDWLKNFSKAWMDYHLPQNRKRPAKSIIKTIVFEALSKKSSKDIKTSKV